ncbi:GntR family transcriptional regulator [Mycolicibacterium novocastrense]|uniref:GntR family transcriptional regulator n=1 Tax=Mycolicibacterium novocastrense TaxID=59813 RepID=A0AAW5SP05_MYCNV|nr:GntR family transcriptional regulator [Mycolicibacterium novocastrense]MCV7025534.1 GntR family transcriptional regulator [Mycolicibacterium novocastrense]GAT08908.1 GntR family transcriptional regulator [Mycolicibacterium novocastrense]
MPKKYGVKEKDLVVAHVVNLVLTGKLRSGDRIDRNEIAQDLGLSRVPIQEAVVQMEHDGILSTRYHRGAFVERFDEAFVREHHELHGFLTGMASARAAAEPDPRVAERLDALTDTLRGTRDSRAFYDAAWQYRTVITDAYAGPRLTALIRSVQAFTPRAFWVAYLSDHDEMLPFYEDETAAIRGGDQEAARAACIARSEAMGHIMVTELVRRGVLRGADASSVTF